MKKNILVLADIHEGGEWFATLRLIKEIKTQSQSYSFSLVGFYDEYRPTLDVFDHIIYVPYSSSNPPLSFIKKIIIDSFHAYQAIKEIIAQSDEVDLILVNHYLMVLPLFILKGFSIRKKIIFFFHGIKTIVIKKFSDIDYRQIIVKILERLSLALSPTIAIPSQAASNYVKRMLGLFSLTKKYYIVPNGVESSYYKRSSPDNLNKFRKKLKISKKFRIILYSGRFVKHKGIENLIEAFNKYLQLDKQSVLIFAFPDSSADLKLVNLIREKVKNSEMSTSIKFLLNSDALDLFKLYQISSVLVLASEMEMAPLVVFESLACGTPCIVTKVGGIDEILSAIEPQLILENSYPKTIYDKLSYFFSLSEHKVKTIQNRSKEISREYSSKNSARKFLQILESLKL